MLQKEKDIFKKKYLWSFLQTGNNIDIAILSTTYVNARLLGYSLNKDGKTCLLKALCEVNQTPKGKVGTFLEEILRAIFT